MKRLIILALLCSSSLAVQAQQLPPTFRDYAEQQGLGNEQQGSRVSQELHREYRVLRRTQQPTPVPIIAYCWDTKQKVYAVCEQHSTAQK